jgi:hypothetical protein
MVWSKIPPMHTGLALVPTIPSYVYTSKNTFSPSNVVQRYILAAQKYQSTW